MEYTDIQIHIHQQDADSGAYPVEAALDDGSFFADGELFLDQQALLVSLVDAQTYGRELFTALFAGPIRRAYNKISGRAEAVAEGRVRVRLWIDDEAAELHALPWERLYHIHKGQFAPLATSALTPFSRYTGLELAEPDPLARHPLRLFIAIANPSALPDGFSPIDVEDEVETLRQALSDFVHSNLLSVTLLPGRTGLSPTLREALTEEGYVLLDGVTSLGALSRQTPKCQLFHFIGHGHFSRQSERGPGSAALFLEREDGSWQAAADEELTIQITTAGRTPHLVYLSACESAKRDDEHAFVGLGPKLVRAGVPAVVAMQDLVPMDLARQLTSDFYRSLFEHGQVDLALNQARRLLFGRDEVDWAIPVLFSRLKGNELIRFPPDPALQTTDEMMAATGRLLAVAQAEPEGQDLVEELEQLLQAWRESHQGLVDVESKLRRVNEDPSAFPTSFRSFYNDFKDYYNSETWIDEESLIRDTQKLRDTVLPKLKPKMDARDYAEVERTLSQHLQVRGRLLMGFGEFLDAMDAAVMAIRSLLGGDDVTGAIRRKRAFELEIAPSLRESRKSLRQLSSQITAVSDLVGRLERSLNRGEFIPKEEIVRASLAVAEPQQSFEAIASRLMTLENVDAPTLRRPDAPVAAQHVQDQITHLIAAQRQTAAQGVALTAETLNRLGWLAVYQRDDDTALAYFRQATQSDPRSPAAFEAIAWLQQSRAMDDIRTQDFDRAGERLAEARRAAERTDPLYPNALASRAFIAKSLAQVARMQGNAADADRFLAQAAALVTDVIRLDPDNASAHNGLGSIELERGNPDAAIIVIRRAIEIQPTYTAAWHDLGAAYWAKMRVDPANAQVWCREALRAFRKASELATDDPSFSPEAARAISGYIVQLARQCD